MLARDDPDVRHVLRHQRIRPRGLDAERVIVHLAHILALGIGGEARRAPLDVRGALEGEHDVVRRERRAVMELHALAQRELPGGVVESLPRGGQPGHGVLLLVHVHQGVENVARHGIVGTEVVEVRIHRGGLGANADGQFACGGGAAQQGGQHDRDERGQYRSSHDGFFLVGGAAGSAAPASKELADS